MIEIEVCMNGSDAWGRADNLWEWFLGSLALIRRDIKTFYLRVKEA